MKKLTHLSFMNRRNAERLMGDNNVALISITTPPDEPIMPRGGFKDVLHLSFEDDDEAFTEIQAKEVIHFASDNIGEVKDLIVHCDAGLSRSPGVCEALEVVFNERVRLMARTAFPNIHVKATILRVAFNWEKQ